MQSKAEFRDFEDFYPVYLQEHTNYWCRRLHFIGTCGVIALSLLFFFTGKTTLLALIPVMGYGFSWTGHYVFERNVPMTFRHPVMSLMGDFRMFWEILTGKVLAF